MSADESSTSPKRKIKVKKKIKKKKLRPEESPAEEPITVEGEKDFTDDEEIVITLGKPPEEMPEEIPEEPQIEEEEDFFLDEEPSFEEEMEGEHEEGQEIQTEEEEEVVVISLGKPPEKPHVEEKVIEDEIEEEAVEVEVVAEGEEKKPPPEEKPERKRKIGALAIVFIIIIAAIVGGFGAYLIFFQNQDPVARLSLSPTVAMAGEAVVCDGSDSSDDKGIEEYKWRFGDDSFYTEDADSYPDGKFDGKTTHFYEVIKTYDVELQVRDDEGKIDKITLPITISELEVTIPFDRVGDEITYDVEGFADVRSTEGFFTTDTPLGEGTLTGVHIDFEGFMETANRDPTRQADGYGDEHDTLVRYNYEELDLSGDVYFSLENAGTGSFQIQDGTLTITDSAYIDLTTNKTIHSDTTTELEISAGPDLGFSSEDHLRSYPHLREKPAVFRVEDLSPDRTFTVGDSQLEILGEVAYHWEVINATNVNGYPALTIDVEIDVDDETIEPYTISEFDMQLYITNGIPFPIKTHVYGVVEDDEGTTITALYDSEIADDGFEAGTTLIPFGDCTEEHYPFRDEPDFEFINWTASDYFPNKGSGEWSFDSFTPHQAFNFAENTSIDLQNYLSTNPDPYVINGYYNETGENDNPKWNLTFGDLENTEGYYVVVEDTVSGYIIAHENSLTLPELLNTTDQLDPILSYSASEAVFKDDQDVNTKAFSGGKVDFNQGYNYGTRANVIYPSISITVSLSLERTEYAYYLEDEDGSLLAGVDAMNGQLMYVWTHDGDDIPFP